MNAKRVQLDQQTRYAMGSNLSIAARAYAVSKEGCNLTSHRHDLSRRAQLLLIPPAIEEAEATIAELVAALDLTWHPIPLIRYMRTQVNELRDALAYARPAAIRGYGQLAADVEEYLTCAQRDLQQWQSQVARQIEAPSHTHTPAGADAEDWALPVNALTMHQHRALHTCIQTSMQETLLLHSYTLCARAPRLPIFQTSFTAAEIDSILRLVEQMEYRLETMAATLGLSISWRDACAELIVTYAARAQLSAQQVLHAISEANDSHRQEAAAFFRQTQKVYRLALDL